MNRFAGDPSLTNVVVCSYNRAESLRRTLDLLSCQRIPEGSYEVLVCDDGSTDHTRAVVESFAARDPRFRYIFCKHGGSASARNHGIRASSGRWIAFTDDDCLPEPGWLGALLSRIRGTSGAVGVQGRTYTPDDEGGVDDRRMNVFARGFGFPTCNILYRADVLRAIGGFDLTFRYPFAEDTALAFRCLTYGEIVFEPSAVVMHPPVPRQTWNRFWKLRYYESEFRLYYRFRRLYRRERFLHPVLTILWPVIARPLLVTWRDFRSASGKRRHELLRTMEIMLCERVLLVAMLPGICAHASADP